MKISKRHRERGVALLSVMIAIAITIVISNEFGTSTSTDMISAANYRDEMRAHFLARSATNLAELVVRIQQRIDQAPQLQQLGPIQITDYADQLVLPFCGSDAEVRDAIGMSPSAIKGLGADIGTCGFNGPFTTEDDKLNVNCANVDAGDTWKITQAVLYAMMYFPAYDSVFDENDAEGWHRDRQMQVASILDYIDSNTMHAHDRGTTEDYGYESLKDRYYPKNYYIDTIGEIKLARGVDDRFWTLFGSALTVYGGCKVNLNALTNPQLIAGLLYLSAKNDNDPVKNDQRRLFLLASYVAKAKQFGEYFGSVQDFVNFVKDPSSSVAMLAGSGGMAGSAATAAMTQGLPNSGEQVGMELNPAQVSSWAYIGPRKTYRIEAYGEIERKQQTKDGKPVYPAIRRTITGVWDMKVVPQNVRKPPAPKGAWVFMKEE